MFQVFLLSSLLLIHEELHRWIGKLAIEEDTKEVIGVPVWILWPSVHALENVDEQRCQRLLIDLVVYLVLRGPKGDLFFMLLESFVFRSFLLLFFFRDDFGASGQVQTIQLTRMIRLSSSLMLIVSSFLRVKNWWSIVMEELFLTLRRGRRRQKLFDLGVAVACHQVLSQEPLLLQAFDG